MTGFVVVHLLEVVAPLLVPPLLAGSAFLAATLVSRWAARRDAGLLRATGLSLGLSAVVALGVPRGASLLEECLRLRAHLGVCFVTTDGDGPGLSGMPARGLPVRRVPDGVCASLGADTLRAHRWVLPRWDRELYRPRIWPDYAQVDEVWGREGVWERDVGERGPTVRFDAERCLLLARPR